MSDPRLTAADVSMYAEWLNDERWDGQTAMRFVDSHEAYRADVDRLTAERDALQQRILGMEDRLDIVTAEDAMKKIAQGGTLHNADGSQRWCWCSTLQAVGSASAKCPPCLARDIERLTAENAALREELATLKAGIKAELGGGNSLPDFWTAERQLPYVTKALTAARAERDALKAELARMSIVIDVKRDNVHTSGRSLEELAHADLKARPPSYSELASMGKVIAEERSELQHELAEARAENAALREQRDAMQALWVGVGRHIDEARIGYNHPQILAVFTENRAVKAERFGLIVRAEQAERELAEAEAEIRWLRNNPIARATGEYLGPMEDWRGANEDGRKEKG